MLPQRLSSAASTTKPSPSAWASCADATRTALPMRSTAAVARYRHTGRFRLRLKAARDRGRVQPMSPGWTSIADLADQGPPPRSGGPRWILAATMTALGGCQTASSGPRPAPRAPPVVAVESPEPPQVASKLPVQRTPRIPCGESTCGASAPVCCYRPDDHGDVTTACRASWQACGEEDPDTFYVTCTRNDHCADGERCCDAEAPWSARCRAHCQVHQTRCETDADCTTKTGELGTCQSEALTSSTPVLSHCVYPAQEEDDDWRG